MKTLQFKIQLKDIQTPPVWRKILVPDNITLDDFHYIIQAAFGWENCHLYKFSLLAWRSEPVYKIPYEEDYAYGAQDSRLTKLSEIFTTPKQKFTYLYDFGDDWIHDITLEEISDYKIIAPVCIAGKGACPPEDCGGVPGYYNMVDILNGPKSREYKELRKWLGMQEDEQWDLNAFDREAVNDKLRLLKV